MSKVNDLPIKIDGELSSVTKYEFALVLAEFYKAKWRQNGYQNPYRREEKQ